MKIILEKDSYLDTPIITVQLAEHSQPNSSTPHRTAHLQPWHGASLEPSKFAARPDGWIRVSSGPRNRLYELMITVGYPLNSHDIAVSIPSIHMAMDQYLLIPFLVGWTSIYYPAILMWTTGGFHGFWPISIFIMVIINPYEPLDD